MSGGEDINAITKMESGADGYLYVGGDGWTSGPAGTYCARWSGSAWSAVSGTHLIYALHQSPSFVATPL